MEENSKLSANEEPAGAVSGYGAAFPPPLYAPVTEQERERQRRERADHFHFFGLASAFYALFYVLCLYRNQSGITYPFFVAGTLFCFCYYMKRSGISGKKDGAFYIVSLLLLGTGIFLTDDIRIILMSKAGIFVLMFVYMIHSIYQDQAWTFSKYLGSVCSVVLQSIGCIGRPFADLFAWLEYRKKNHSESGKGKYVALGLIITVPLLLLIVSLLASADAVFAELSGRLLDNIRIPAHFFGLLVSLLFGFYASYCISAALAKKTISEKTTDKRTGEPVVAITFTSVLSVIYLLFSAIQIVCLFAGKLRLPEGMTYAQYARQGFFQLLFVCVINLVLVLVCLYRFRGSRALKGILTVICGCTYVMIASSAFRMILYIRYYYLTFLRMFVLWSLLVILLLMTGVLITIYKPRFGLFRYSMIAVTALYLCFSFSRPDYWIARCNLSNSRLPRSEQEAAENTHSFFLGEPYSDYYYLRQLSADAAPVLLKADWRNTGSRESYAEHIDAITRGMNVRSFNLSRYQAGQLLKQQMPLE